MLLLRTVIGLTCACAVTLATSPAKGTMERRAPAMGFMGMRGKKDIAEDKRAPAMGFMGMRGKKDNFYDITPDIYPEDKRAMGFVGMRGKKDTDFDYFEYPGDKRAPMGFQGVRGKKDDYFKRAMGFQGVRGKKDEYPDDEFSDEMRFPENDEYWPTDDFDKRAPSSGFLGMRGKKGPNNSGFFGMRGKKIPSSGFFGSRGKKGPMSGFLGVRGKKDSDGDLETLLSLLSEKPGGNSKRAPTPYNYRNFADSAFSVEVERPGSSESCP